MFLYAAVIFRNDVVAEILEMLVLNGISVLKQLKAGNRSQNPQNLLSTIFF